MRRSIESSQIDLVLQRPGLSDDSGAESPTVVLIKDKPRGEKRSWAAFLAPRFLRRRVRVFHHADWQLRADDAPLDEEAFLALLADAERLRIPPAVREDGRSRGRSTYTLKMRLPKSHASARYRWLGKGPEGWSDLVSWADRFRRFVDPLPTETLEGDAARLEELERFAGELDDEFRRASITEHMVEWQRELTRIGAMLDAAKEDPVPRLRRLSAHIDQIYDVMKIEIAARGDANWPPRMPG